MSDIVYDRDRDLYEQFGIAPSASPEEISRAHKRLAKECHPDLHPDKAWATERFKELNRAYALLKDPVAKGEYDRQRWAEISEGRAGEPPPKRSGFSFRRPQRGDGQVDPELHHKDRMMSYFIAGIEALVLTVFLILVLWRALTKHKY